MNTTDLEQKAIDALKANDLDSSSIFFTGYAFAGEEYLLLVRSIFNAENQDADLPEDLIKSLKSGKQTVDTLPPEYVMGTEIFSFNFEKKEFTPNPGAITLINSETVPLHEDKNAFYKALEKDLLEKEQSNGFIPPEPFQ